MFWETFHLQKVASASTVNSVPLCLSFGLVFIKGVLFQCKHSFLRRTLCSVGPDGSDFLNMIKSLCKEDKSVMYPMVTPCIFPLQLGHRERQARNYNQKLKEKFQHHPQIKRIARHRHLPKPVFHQAKELRVMREARRRQ